MKRYNNEDYFSVIDIRTGRKIVDCGEEIDALLMVSIDPQNRTITKNKFIMGPVIDIEMQKALPTSGISIDSKSYQEHQDNWMVEKINKLSDPGPVRLPEGQGKPVKV